MKMKRFETSRELCYKIPYTTLACRNGHDCARCEIADSIRKVRIEKNKDNSELFFWNDVRPATPMGGGRSWIYMPVISKPETLKKAGLEVNMYNQIFITTDGLGMFFGNDGSELDGYFLAEPNKVYTFGRQDFYGIPNDKAVRRYEELFLIDLKRYMKGR